VQVDFDTPGARRAVSLAAVAGLHILVIALLMSQSASFRAALPIITRTRLLPEPAPRPPPPPAITPRLAPPAMFVPLPSIAVAAPPERPAAPRAVAPGPNRAAPGLHFGAATGGVGTGLDIDAAAGGGAASRGSLADFEAAVKRKVLAGKRQPSLAWDRRNTCVVNYALRIDRAGGLAGFTIAPCAVPEINEAARQAIRLAAPFPAPPDLGAASVAVRGSLIFGP
jgi:protein TonB